MFLPRFFFLRCRRCRRRYANAPPKRDVFAAPAMRSTARLMMFERAFDMRATRRTARDMPRRADTLFSGAMPPPLRGVAAPRAPTDYVTRDAVAFLPTFFFIISPPPRTLFASA
jgi:hypothetical protein